MMTRLVSEGCPLRHLFSLGAVYGDPHFTSAILLPGEETGEHWDGKIQ